MQQTGDPDINGRTAFIVGIAFNAQCLQLCRVGVEGREQAAGGLLKTSIRIGLKFTYVARQFKGGLPLSNSCPCSVAGEKPSICCAGAPVIRQIQHRARIHGLRRECGTHANFPALLLRRKRLTRELKARHLSSHFPIAIALRAHRYKQGATCAGGSLTGSG